MAEENSTIDYKKILKKQRDHEYYLKNKERILQKTAEYEKTHREQRNAAQNRRNANNREINRKRGLDYYYANRDKIMQFRRGNKQISADHKKFTRQYRDELFEILGGPKCVRCGYEEDKDCLQFDHIDGGRKDDKKYQVGMRTYLRYYSLNPEEARQKLQILCVSCNWLKSLEIDRIKAKANIVLKNTPIAIRDRIRKPIATKKYKRMLLEILGSKKCIKCGESRFDLLQFDHINGNGNIDRKRLNNHIYTYYIKNPEEARKTLQVLCCICNWKKEKK